MAWIFKSLARNVEQRFTKFALNKTIGPFLAEKLTLDQIEFSAMDGKFELKSLVLGVQAINALLVGLPVRFVEGSIDRVSGRVPYKNVLEESCEVNIDGVCMVLEICEPGSTPASDTADPDDDDGEDAFQTSLDVANGDDEGVRSLQYVLDTILARVRIAITNIRVELRCNLSLPSASLHMPSDIAQLAASFDQFASVAATLGVPAELVNAIAASLGRSPFVTPPTVAEHSEEHPSGPLTPVTTTLTFHVLLAGVLIRDITAQNVAEPAKFDPANATTAIKAIELQALDIQYSIGTQGRVSLLSFGSEPQLMTVNLSKVATPSRPRVDMALTLQDASLSIEPRTLALLAGLAAALPTSTPREPAGSVRPDQSSFAIKATVRTVHARIWLDPLPFSVFDFATRFENKDGTRGIPSYLELHAERLSLHQSPAGVTFSVQTLSLVEHAHNCPPLAILRPTRGPGGSDGALRGRIVTTGEASQKTEVRLDLSGLDVNFDVALLDRIGYLVSLTDQIPAITIVAPAGDSAAHATQAEHLPNTSPATSAAAHPATSAPIPITSVRGNARSGSGGASGGGGGGSLGGGGIARSAASSHSGTPPIARASPRGAATAATTGHAALQPVSAIPPPPPSTTLLLSFAHCRLFMLTPLPVFPRTTAVAGAPYIRPSMATLFTDALCLTLARAEVTIALPQPGDLVRVVEVATDSVAVALVKWQSDEKLFDLFKLGSGRVNVTQLLQSSGPTAHFVPHQRAAGSSMLTVIPTAKIAATLAEIAPRADFHISVHLDLLVGQLTRPAYAALMAYVTHLTMYEPALFTGVIFPALAAVGVSMQQHASAAPTHLGHVAGTGLQDSDDSDDEDRLFQTVGPSASRSTPSRPLPLAASAAAAAGIAPPSATATATPPTASATSAATITSQPSASATSAATITSQPSASRPPLKVRPPKPPGMAKYFLVLHLSVAHADLVLHDPGLLIPDPNAPRDPAAGPRPAKGALPYRVVASGLAIDAAITEDPADARGIAISMLGVQLSELQPLGEVVVLHTTRTVDPHDTVAFDGPTSTVDTRYGEWELPAHLPDSRTGAGSGGAALGQTQHRPFSPSFASLPPRHDMGFATVQLSLSLSLDPRTNTKDLTVVADVRAAHLQHEMRVMEENWLLRLIDFSDVPEPRYPIDPVARLIRLHIHFRDLQIAYSPKNISTRALIESKHVYVCSNIVPQAAMTTLAFEFYDTSLFLAESDAFIATYHPGVDPVTGGYRGVMQDDKLAVQLQLAAAPDRRPEVAVSISNVFLFIDVCSDSFSALISILQYYFTDGDLPPPPKAPRSASSSVEGGGHASDADGEGDDESEALFYSAVEDRPDPRRAVMDTQKSAVLTDALRELNATTRRLEIRAAQHDEKHRHPRTLKDHEDDDDDDEGARTPQFFDTHEDHFDKEQTCRECHRAALPSGLCSYHQEIADVAQTRTNARLLSDAMSVTDSPRPVRVGGDGGVLTDFSESSAASSPGHLHDALVEPVSPVRRTLATAALSCDEAALGESLGRGPRSAAAYAHSDTARVDQMPGMLQRPLAAAAATVARFQAQGPAPRTASMNNLLAAAGTPSPPLVDASATSESADEFIPELGPSVPLGRSELSHHESAAGANAMHAAMLPSLWPPRADSASPTFTPSPPLMPMLGVPGVPGLTAFDAALTESLTVSISSLESTDVEAQLLAMPVPLGALLTGVSAKSVTLPLAPAPQPAMLPAFTAALASAPLVGPPAQAQAPLAPTQAQALLTPAPPTAGPEPPALAGGAFRVASLAAPTEYGVPTRLVPASTKIAVNTNHFNPFPTRPNDLLASNVFPEPLLRISVTDVNVSVRLHSGSDWGLAVPTDSGRGTTTAAAATHAATSTAPGAAAAAAGGGPSSSPQVARPATRGAEAAAASAPSPMRLVNHGMADVAARAAMGSAPTALASPRPDPLAATLFATAHHQPQSPETRRRQAAAAAVAALPTQATQASARREEHIALSLRGLSVVVETYPADTVHSMRISLFIRDIEIVDKVQMSLMNKFLSDFKSEQEPRETYEPMARLDYVLVRTPGALDEEVILRLALLPLRLNVDQDTLDFLITFFACMLAYEEAVAAASPVPQTEPAALPYIKLCQISALTAIIDYDPKHLTLSSLLRGNLAEMAGLVSLRGAALRLPPVVVKGLLGFPAVGKAVLEQWLASYSDKLPGLLVGVPLVRPVTNVVFAGARMMHQPFASYPRVLQGLRQGIFGGVTTTTVEFCNVSMALLFATRGALATAQSVISGVSPSRGRVPQPSSITEGFVAAASVFKSGWTGLWDRLRPGSRSGSMLRHVVSMPTATLQPLMATLESAALILEGFRNSLHPDTRRDLSDKYRA